MLGLVAMLGLVGTLGGLAVLATPGHADDAPHAEPGRPIDEPAPHDHHHAHHEAASASASTATAPDANGPETHSPETTSSADASSADASSAAERTTAPVVLTSIPEDLGLPLQVHTAVYFVDMLGVDENAQTFDATVDVRLTWRDRRLADATRFEPVTYSGRATLEVERSATETAAPIFIPLIASLVIPLLAIWLNRIEGDEFKIEAFELANIIVGGLFAVIALNFTVSSAYEALGRGDNTVSRLFALNYVTLATSLAVNLFVFRFRVLRRFGPYVESEFFRHLTWSIPLAAIVTAVALVLVAWA